jgi:hypothetical protein
LLSNYLFKGDAKSLTRSAGASRGDSRALEVEPAKAAGPGAAHHRSPIKSFYVDRPHAAHAATREHLIRGFIELTPSRRAYSRKTRHRSPQLGLRPWQTAGRS